MCNNLQDKCIKAKEYIKNHSIKTDNTTSELWDDLLSNRKNFPPYEEMKTFIKEGYNYGTGNSKFADADQENFNFRKSSVFKSYKVSDDFIKKIIEPKFGCPIFSIEHNGNKYSGNYYRNIMNAYEIYLKYKNTSELTILEIGAGTGLLANILHQVLDIKSYIIVDLKENLYLASVYLQETLNKDITYVTNKNICSCNGLVASLPEYIDYLKLDLDLVINAHSFGEMPSDIVEQYIKYSYDNLKDTGLLFSHNRLGIAHNKNGVKKLSEFISNKFTIDTIKNSPSNTCLNYDLHHIMFLKKNSKEYNEDYIDLIGYFIKSGIHNSNSLIEHILSNNLTNEEIKFLDMLTNFFQEKDLLKKGKTLSENVIHDNNLLIILLHYKIMIKFINGQFDKSLFETYYNLVKNFESISYDIIIIYMIAAKNCYPIKNELYNDIIESDIVHYLEDVKEILDNSKNYSLKNFIKFIINHKTNYLQEFIKNKFIVVY